MYDITTREETQPQRAPLQRYVVRYSNATICYPFGIYYVYSNGATSFLYPGHKIVKGCPMKQHTDFTSLEAIGQAF
jgi:hypothetical protein